MQGTARATIAAGLLGLGSCTAATSALASDKPPQPRAVVQAMFDAFNRHDPEAMRALYHPDAVLTSSDFCAPRRQTDVIRTYAELFAHMPTIHDEIEQLLVDGDRVAVRFVAKPAPAASTGLKIMAFLRVKDGLIIEDDTVFNHGNNPCSP